MKKFIDILEEIKQTSGAIKAAEAREKGRTRVSMLNGLQEV